MISSIWRRREIYFTFPFHLLFHLYYISVSPSIIHSFPSPPPFFFNDSGFLSSFPCFSFHPSGLASFCTCLVCFSHCVFSYHLLFSLVPVLLLSDLLLLFVFALIRWSGPQTALNGCLQTHFQSPKVFSFSGWREISSTTLQTLDLFFQHSLVLSWDISCLFPPYFTLPPTLSFNLYIPPSHPLRYLSSLSFFLLLLPFHGVCGVSLFHFASFLSHIFNPQTIYRLITPSFLISIWFFVAARLFLPGEVLVWNPPSPVSRCAGCCLMQPSVMCCLIQLLVFLNDRDLFVKPSVEL